MGRIRQRKLSRRRSHSKLSNPALKLRNTVLGNLEFNVVVNHSNISQDDFNNTAPGKVACTLPISNKLVHCFQIVQPLDASRKRSLLIRPGYVGD